MMNNDQSPESPDDEPGDDSNGSSYTKPNCTIRDRHIALLEEMVEQRYMSRSEALRAAIEDHYRTLEGDSEITIEYVAEQVNTLQTKLNELNETIEETQQQPIQMIAPSKVDADMGQALGEQSPIGAGDDQSSVSTQDEVYDSILELGPASVEEIAEYCELSPLEVRDAIEDLVDSGFVTPVEDESNNQYRTAQA